MTFIAVITVLRPHSLCIISRPSCLLAPAWMKQSAESHWELQFISGSIAVRFHLHILRNRQTSWVKLHSHKGSVSILSHLFSNAQYTCLNDVGCSKCAGKCDILAQDHSVVVQLCTRRPTAEKLNQWGSCRKS